MRIEHVALWTRDIEGLKSFYASYFDGKAGEPRYTGDSYYESCVLDPDGNRVEITV